MLKRIWIFIKMLCLTLRTPHWVQKVYSKMCQLDYEDVQQLPVGMLWAIGSLVQYQPKGSKFRFTISETSPGKIHAMFKHQDSDSWIESYRQGEKLLEVEWIRQLKILHKFMKRNKVYVTRELQLIEEMKNIGF